MQIAHLIGLTHISDVDFIAISSPSLCPHCPSASAQLANSSSL